MLQAAIVEDERVFLENTRDLLSAEFDKRHVSIAFDPFGEGQSFLNALSQHFSFDIVFLDIEMPGIDGISVCRKIRQMAPETMVVFVSNKEELVFQTFEVQPFRFIRKSELKEVVGSLVDAILTEIKRRSPQVIILQEPTGGDVFSFDIRNILYIEAQRKDCRIVTISGESVARIKLSDLESRVKPYSFIKTHRSYLVNPAHIAQIKKGSVLLENGQEIPISRGLYDKVRQDFISYTMI